MTSHRPREATRPEPVDNPLADVVSVMDGGSDQPLFDGFEPPASAGEDLSPDRRRTARQQHQVTHGIHPLTGGPIHEHASRDRTPASGRTDPFTCGSCVHRVLLGYHAGTYPKCDAGDGQRITHSAASDVRAWWPACANFEPKADARCP